jgi:HK97 family phage major capsid protein
VIDKEALKRARAEALDALERSASGLEAAIATGGDTAIGEARTMLQTARSEFDRAEANLRDADALGEVRALRAQPVSDPALLGMDAPEVRAYSLMRALNAQATGSWKGAELEREASDAVAQRMGREPQGFFVPMDVQQRASMAVGGTVATDLLAGSFIDMLRNRPVVAQAGATFLGGLVGNIAIPRQTAGATGYWVGENTDITGETHPTIDQVTMHPHTLGAYSDLGRLLLKQSSVDVENMVWADLTRVGALAVDLAALSGTGATVYPKGIAAQDNVNAVAMGTDGAAPTWAKMVEFETAVSADNADLGRLAYVLNAKARGFLKSTPKVATYSATMMWNDAAPANPVNGYPTFVSNQCRADLTKASGTGLSEIFFGNWADLIIGQWGGVDMIVNPYTGAKQGLVQVVMLQEVDICVRHGESFARSADALV